MRYLLIVSSALLLSTTAAWADCSQADLPACIRQLQAAASDINRLQQTTAGLATENAALKKQLATDERTLGSQYDELERFEQKMRQSIPRAEDFYVKDIPSQIQHSSVACNGDDVMISAACTNHHGAQTAVGPQFASDQQGHRIAICQRYGNEVWEAEGQVVCMKLH